MSSRVDEVQPVSTPSRGRHARRIVIGVAATILLVEAYVAVFLRENDFIFHRVLGEAFLRGDPYVNGGDWYPLPRVMLDALIAAPPLRLARGLSFALAAVALAYGVRRWHQLGELRLPLPRDRWFAATTLAGVVMLPYLLRDFDECGLQLFLLFLLTAGGWALSRGQSIRAGFWLATAAAYKLTPLLCLPYLLWKRRWSAAVAMVAWLGVWAVAPAAFVGRQKTIASHEQFIARSRVVAAHRTAYPEVPGVELPKVQNQSLHAAVARYLETHPADHPLVVDHPWFVQFGNLDGQTAYLVVRLALLGLAAVLAWNFRRSAAGPLGSSDFPAEWAVVCLLCALAAPLCWKQHLVVGLPAVLLVARRATSPAPRSKMWFAALATIGAVLILARHGIIGRETSIVLMSYKVDTACMLAVLALTCLLPRRSSESAGVATIGKPESSVRRAA